MLEVSLFAVWKLGEKLVITASPVFISSAEKGLDIEFYFMELAALILT